MDHIGRHYLVASTPRNAPLHDHLQHGYEFEEDFRSALRKIISRWHDRVGECVGERSGFLRIRFHDTPGGNPDEEWLPTYLLQEVATPPYAGQPSDDSQPDKGHELNRAFGFD